MFVSKQCSYDPAKRETSVDVPPTSRPITGCLLMALNDYIRMMRELEDGYHTAGTHSALTVLA